MDDGDIVVMDCADRVTDTIPRHHAQRPGERALSAKAPATIYALVCAQEAGYRGHPPGR